MSKKGLKNLKACRGKQGWTSYFEFTINIFAKLQHLCTVKKKPPKTRKNFCLVRKLNHRALSCDVYFFHLAHINHSNQFKYVNNGNQFWKKMSKMYKCLGQKVV